MYRIFYSILFISFAFSLFSQERIVNIPRLSPLQKTEITIGVVDFRIDYFRPSIKGRKIFGDLVPYGEVWRTGANKNTKLTISDDVVISGNILPKGSYSIFTKPNRDNWQVIFYSELDEYGVPDPIDQAKIIIEFAVPQINLEKSIESLSINFENLMPKAVDLVIGWERSQISIPIVIPNKQIVESNLDNKLESLISDYWAASFILFDIENDYSAALIAINKAISLIEDNRSFDEYVKIADLNNRHIPNKYLLKSEILAAQNDFERAIIAAEKSLVLADLVNDSYYRKENMNNLLKWRK